MGRTEATLQAAKERLLKELPGDARIDYVVGDGTKAADVARAVDVAQSLAGGLRICVTTVGGGNTTAPFLILDEKMMVAAYEHNVVSAFLAMKYSTPAMKDNGGGSVVCISSVAANATSPFLASYIAAKAGLEALIRAAAVELAPFGIRVNAIRPGSIASRPRSDAEIARADQAAQRLPLRRIGVPPDIAAGVRYLAGPESSYVTGQSYAIDGGGEVIPIAPSFETMIRQQYGDEAVDTALSGTIPKR